MGRPIPDQFGPIRNQIYDLTYKYRNYIKKCTSRAGTGRASQHQPRPALAPAAPAPAEPALAEPAPADSAPAQAELAPAEPALAEPALARLALALGEPALAELAPEPAF